MTDRYATREDLVARLSPQYQGLIPEAGDGLNAVLLKASEAIDHLCFGRVQAAWDDGETTEAVHDAIVRATCDQVEYWLETGEEFDVTGLHGALIGGKVQVQHLPADVGQRARRTLSLAGLYWAGAGIVP